MTDNVFNIIVVLIALMAFIVYLTERKRIRTQERIRYELERENKDRQFKMDKEKFELEQSRLGMESGGFIVVDMPENMKSMFQDLLKGFEEFARLKGYSVSFSVDSAIHNKFGFKFTILSDGVTVSTQNCKKRYTRIY